MARGVTKPLNERISDIEDKKQKLQSKIDNYKTKISEFDAQIKALQEEAEKAKYQKVFEAIKDSGKTPEEILSSLNLDPKSK